MIEVGAFEGLVGFFVKVGEQDECEDGKVDGKQLDINVGTLDETALGLSVEIVVGTTLQVGVVVRTDVGSLVGNDDGSRDDAHVGDIERLVEGVRSVWEPIE